jgi:hypothetical protein
VKEFDKTGFAERLKAAAEAKARRLARFKPKAAVTDPLFDQRDAMKAAELDQVRADRGEARQAAKDASAAVEAAVVQATADAAAADLDAKRGVRKERKALSKAEAQAKRDARYAARKARQ